MGRLSHLRDGWQTELSAGDVQGHAVSMLFMASFSYARDA